MRARNIKPGFFKNEILAELNPLARILFEGLWCLADRAGRLEDRPKRIKSEVLPYDDCDVNALLNDLANSPERFIIRYEANANRFIQITNFNRHQNPHVKEATSTIPAPCLNSTSTEVAVLIPDSPLLIPDSPSTDSLKPKQGVDNGDENTLYEDELPTIYKAIEMELHVQLTPSMMAFINDMKDFGIVKSGFVYAASETAKGGGNFKYFETVVKNLLEANIKTDADLVKYKKERERQKNQARAAPEEKPNPREIQRARPIE